MAASAATTPLPAAAVSAGLGVPAGGRSGPLGNEWRGNPGWFGSWLGGGFGAVVNQELVPAGIDRGGVVAELAVHLFDQPFVLPEW